MSTWVLGKDADPAEVMPMLTCAPFDCVVIMYSTAVADTDPIAIWVKTLVYRQETWRKKDQPSDESEMENEFFWQKAIYGVDDRSYIVLHRGKVKNCKVTLWCYRSSGTSYRSSGTSATELGMATVELQLDDQRQNMSDMNLGILRAQAGIDDEQVDDLAEWIVRSRVSIVTGYFGDNKLQVQKLAMRAKAISSNPIAQWLKVPRDHIFPAVADGIERPMRTVCHPSYFLCFGYYRRIQMCDPTPVPDQWTLGADLQREMIDVKRCPIWPLNDFGSPFVKHLGAIKTKAVDWNWWIHNVVQSCVWFGTSMPSKNSQVKQANRSGGKGKGKDKNKGKGKRKGKDKDKGKGKGKVRGKGKYQ